ncbi:phage holin family protein [Pseudoxanthomonas daejeonensis]|uniref:phage holin family protein n=1 Tax=Pseudoxanthomonas daejeonensis TaxID=266062 RepID=UPI001F53EA30|nr:phage holin family protein [Pseudoxanthomonas daejeonensis]UNK56267.1 phage holin family protein [Pseudoxanthomonas daejeonensis]
MSEGERTEQAGDATPPPPLDESLRAVSEAGKATLGATKDSLRSLRALLSADLALARSALGRGIAWAGVAVVFGASAWLLATAAGVALMQRFGLSWLASLSIAALFNLAITGLAAWRTSRFFDYMGLHATRRQLSRMGVFDEHGEDDDDGNGEAPRADAVAASLTMAATPSQDPLSQERPR